jgi:hypothetical protein
VKLVSLISRAGHAIYFHLLRGAERLFGPGMVFVLITPGIVFTVLRRSGDFSQFRRLRSSLPASFWKGVPSLDHFVRMFRTWTRSMTVPLFSDRLNSPAWRRRITVRGNPPQLLPEWGRQPMVIAFLHTGGYPILRSWLRAQRVPAALYLDHFPRMTRHAQKLRDDFDRDLELEGIPHHFAGSRSLRDAVRFLKPGCTLLVALEERDFRKPHEAYTVKDRSICLSRVAFRLAFLGGALLLPAAVRETGLGRFEITFSPPLPAGLMGEDDLRQANQYLLGELWPGVEDDPCSLTWTTLEAMSPPLIQKRRPWP